MDIPNTEFARAFDRVMGKKGTHEIVSKVAYLIGVHKIHFEKEQAPFLTDIYLQLDRDKSARIIRHLSIVRTAIIRNFKSINDKMRYEYRSFLSLTEFLPMDSIHQLSSDGVSFIKKSSSFLSHHIIEINRLLSDRINNCKHLFPTWLKWEYIRDLFVMPNGLTDEGTKDASDLFYANKSSYPYQIYINWRPSDAGNILFNDKKFASLLYEQHNDYFADESKVSDAGDKVKANVYDFIATANTVIIVVDCENSDPYKLCSTLKNLDDSYLQKVSKIILFDDVHTVDAWKILEDYTQIPIEHILIERLKHQKSLVDIKLTVRVSQEHYTGQADSFILVSSDSDYWGMISSMPSARFLVMVEREKCGPDIKEALINSGIFYCYLDDFYSGNSDIKNRALFSELYRYLDSSIHLNVNAMLDESLKATRIYMSPAERSQFFDKHIRNMTLVIDENGNVSLELKR